MIGSLHGTIASIHGNHLLIQVGGVGYEVLASHQVLHNLQVGAETSLIIHTHVKEDALSLFGFTSLQEREFFLKALSISGIGPKTAMELLALPMQQLMQAITLQDPALLTTVPGIGKKTAERVLLEMKGKFKGMEHMESLGGAGEHETSGQHFQDILVALEQLGYQRPAIQQTLQKYQKEHEGELQPEEEVLRYCLQHLV